MVAGVGVAGGHVLAMVAGAAADDRPPKLLFDAEPPVEIRGL
jgi:hypothetical protein